MSDLSYRMDVQFTPERPAPGEQVTIDVRVEEVEGEVASVHLSVPEGAIFETLEAKEKGVYSLTRPVPYEAYPGSYEMRLYARDKEGNRGPDVTTSITIS